LFNFFCFLENQDKPLDKEVDNLNKSKSIHILNVDVILKKKLASCQVLILNLKYKGMQRTLVIETLKKLDEVVTLKGWVSTVRNHGKITFIDLRDRTGLIQCVGTVDEKISVESSIELTGKVVKRPEKLINKDIETGSIELQLSDFKLLSSSVELPFDMGKKDLDLSLPILLDHRPLTLKNLKQKAIFKVQEAVSDSFREASKKMNCQEIFVPTISASSTEGGSEVFRVDYYGFNAYLTQSPQLYKQIAVGVFERVFLFSHAYRAEPSVTTRHLSEVVQMDCEIGFIENFDELLDIAEFVGTNIIINAYEKTTKEMEMFGVTKPLLNGKVPRLTLTEAQEIIEKRTGRKVVGEKDLAPDDEIEICKWAVEEKKSDFVMITHFPTKKRAFYTMPDPANLEFSLSFDILFKGLEICSGSQRINKYDDLVEAIKDRGMDPANFENYLYCFKYGMPPEGGFSFGLERITMKLLELKNVREASLFPRDMERVDVRLSTIDKKVESGNIYESIVEGLKVKGIEFEKYEHEPVFTSEGAAKVRGTDIHQGAKALVLQADKEYVLLVLPADLKADLEALKLKKEYKKIAMASKETVKAKTGLEVGSIPPLGSLMGLKTIVDARLSENKEIVFNAGRHDRSIKLKYEDYLRFENPEIINFNEK
jgi:nondiscriminating aspartyl-tRNA synthetase